MSFAPVFKTVTAECFIFDSAYSTAQYRLLSPRRLRGGGCNTPFSSDAEREGTVGRRRKNNPLREKTTACRKECSKNEEIGVYNTI